MDQEEYDRLVQAREKVRSETDMINKEIKKRKKKIEVCTVDDKWYYGTYHAIEAGIFSVFSLIFTIMAFARNWGKVKIISLIFCIVIWGAFFGLLIKRNRAEEEIANLEQEIDDLKKQAQALNESYSADGIKEEAGKSDDIEEREAGEGKSENEKQDGIGI